MAQGTQEHKARGTVPTLLCLAFGQTPPNLAIARKIAPRDQRIVVRQLSCRGTRVWGGPLMCSISAMPIVVCVTNQVTFPHGASVRMTLT